MLHIKDIEAFARINEALNEAENATPRTAGEHDAHPAMILAMVATGRLPMSALAKPVADTPPQPPQGQPTKRP